MLRLLSRGNAGAEGRGPGRLTPAPVPQVPQAFLASFQPSRRGRHLLPPRAPAGGQRGWGGAGGSFAEPTPKGSWGSIVGKLGATCNFIPWEEEPEKSAGGGDENGVEGWQGWAGRPGELLGEGRDLARSPRPSSLSKLSPNSWPPPPRNQNTTRTGRTSSTVGRADSRRHRASRG